MVTYMMSDENSFNLKYSNTGTFHELIILEHCGIYWGEKLKPRVIKKDTYTIKNKINKLFKKLINK